MEGQKDTKLLNLLFKINLAFLHDHGVYYPIQHSIGEEMLIREEDRLKTYREFCECLLNPEERIWYERLLLFYLETGENKKVHRIEMAIAAIKDVSIFLDTNVRGGASIKERMMSEGLEKTV